MRTREKIEKEHKVLVEACPDRVGLICNLTSLEVLLDIRELLHGLSEKARSDE